MRTYAGCTGIDAVLYQLLDNRTKVDNDLTRLYLMDLGKSVLAKTGDVAGCEMLCRMLTVRSSMGLIVAISTMS